MPIRWQPSDGQLGCGILTGGHIILGLPGETHDTMVAQAEILSDLPLATLKIHQVTIDSWYTNGA